MALLVCVAFVAQASGVIAGNTTKLYWRDNFGAPNDSYIEAAPGDTVFAALWVNNNQWSSTRNGRILATVDGAVIDALTWAPEFAPYAHLKDYRNGGHFDPADADPNPAVMDLNFGGSNVYIYTYGSDTGGAPLATTFDYIGTYGADPGGRLIGFYIPIRADAAAGSTIFSVKVTGQSAWSSSIVWSEELSDTVNTDWALEINVVPEPATMGVLGFGGLAALLRRRRK